MNEILKELKNKYNYKIIDDENNLTIYNNKNNNIIEITKESYNTYSEYIIIFKTQHYHIKEIEDLIDCVDRIINDKILPIEFYKGNKNIFGGDIPIELYKNLTISSLKEHFNIVEEKIDNLECEIYSWTGNYDIKKQPIENIIKGK